MMVKYVKYLKDTGEIRQWGSTTEDNPIFSPDFVEGDLCVLLGEGTNATHYVQLPDQVIVQKPVQPSPYHVFNYSTAQWVMNGVIAWESIRVQRDKLLAACDWTVMPDVPLSDARKEAWMAYRQELRDITDQANPLVLVWPTPPN